MSRWTCPFAARWLGQKSREQKESHSSYQGQHDQAHRHQIHYVASHGPNPERCSVNHTVGIVIDLLTAALGGRCR